MERLGGRIYPTLRDGGGLVFLKGPLGAGKTTLVRGLLRAAGHRGGVKSPTFTLVEPYEDLAPPVFHFDLYRIADPEELEYVGLWDYLRREALVLVEWPERGHGVLPPPCLEVDIAYASTGRLVRLHPALSDANNQVRY
jgi:tRNA threonylcarbamoyladenosine biosynthesis protein TsaE